MSSDFMPDSLRKVAAECAKICGKGSHTVATAESCTGGLVGFALTAVPGSSDYFTGGVISYSNEVKTKVLGVKLDSLAAHGAVSEKVATEMAEGVRRLTSSAFGISTTGIAGPGGGTDLKPVGTVWMAVVSENQSEARKKVFSGDRSEVRRKAAEYVIAMLNEVISR